jgi:hypothetical protein
MTVVENGGGMGCREGVGLAHLLLLEELLLMGLVRLE